MQAVFIRELRIDTPLREKEFLIAPVTEEERTEELLKAIDTLGPLYRGCEFELIPARLVVKYPNND